MTDLSFLGVFLLTHLGTAFEGHLLQGSGDKSRNFVLFLLSVITKTHWTAATHPVKKLGC